MVYIKTYIFTHFYQQYLVLLTMPPVTSTALILASESHCGRKVVSIYTRVQITNEKESTGESAIFDCEGRGEVTTPVDERRKFFFVEVFHQPL